MLNCLVQLQGSTPVQNTQTMQLDAGQVIALVQPLLKPFEESLTILKEYKGQQEQSALRKQVQQAEMADSIRKLQEQVEDQAQLIEALQQQVRVFLTTHHFDLHPTGCRHGVGSEVGVFRDDTCKCQSI